MTQSDSVNEKFELLKKLGAAMSMNVIRDANGTPLCAAIFVVGQPETEDIVNVCNAVEEHWHADED